MLYVLSFLGTFHKTCKIVCHLRFFCLRSNPTRYRLRHSVGRGLSIYFLSGPSRPFPLPIRNRSPIPVTASVQRPSFRTMSAAPQQISTDTEAPIPITASSNGKLSGKPWKALKTATVRSQCSIGHKAKSWQDRMEKTKKEHAIKKLETELKDEKKADIKRRRDITLARRNAAEERLRLEEEKAKDGCKKSRQAETESRKDKEDKRLIHSLSRITADHAS
ncbi:hypothetical protein SERLA73DRAFT_174130, partial [Serpula lacrymans var. lacrymans S7.3]